MDEHDPRLQFRPHPAASDIEGPISQLLDLTYGSDQGTIFFRSQNEWKRLAPGISDGLVLTSGGPNADVYWSLGSVYLSPAFTAFAISGQTTLLEVGTSIAGGAKTFTWTTTNSTNVQANSISITDTTASTLLASGLANTGSTSITIAPIANSGPANHVWTIVGQNTHLTTFSRTFTVTWEWRVYAGTNAAETLTANQIKGLTDSSALQASYPGTYNLSASDYKYFCYPDSLGSVTNFIDANTGFPISMATAADNAAYSNTANGWSYALVSVTNANGVATNYRVYRSQYTLGGTLSMRVT